MKLKNVYVQGANGKMGKLISELAIERGLSADGLISAPKAGGVVIDFSSPDGMLLAIKYCEKHKLPFMSGTTGLNKEHEQALNKLSKKVPVLWASNTSLGIFLVSKMLESLALGEWAYEYHLEEIHHKRKVDAPSGTAITLKSNLESKLKKKKVGVTSIRGGGVFGVHKIFALGEEEVITIEHQALSRKVFARGAIDCADWLVNNKPGRYTIEDRFKRI
jgi:4-hydroxy-tetrahydrodipicolinate reductase